jgi:hypothetical protein
MIMLTNCTFDGIVYDVERVIEECLAIKPDLIFLWDEAWFAFARFHPVYRSRTAMACAKRLVERLRDPCYQREYAEYAERLGPARTGTRRHCWRLGCGPTRTGPGCGCTRPSPPTRR